MRAVPSSTGARRVYSPTVSGRRLGGHGFFPGLGEDAVDEILQAHEGLLVLEEFDGQGAEAATDGIEGRQVIAAMPRESAEVFRAPFALAEHFGFERVGQVAGAVRALEAGGLAHAL
jgi:hypothetical protein